ncbi:hypothetical protein [Novosphingobium kaempferiae]|uniref:hypothetical protein n=1 Tax=Novosphingobium kaempferiae TaxID=2896849 RepID=UPI001E35FC40|nr:hypothetical protein [Novosphingobium kaempferiae]
MKTLIATLIAGVGMKMIGSLACLMRVAAPSRPRAYPWHGKESVGIDRQSQDLEHASSDTI